MQLKVDQWLGWRWWSNGMITINWRLGKIWSNLKARLRANEWLGWRWWSDSVTWGLLMTRYDHKDD